MNQKEILDSVTKSGRRRAETDEKTFSRRRTRGGSSSGFGHRGESLMTLLALFGICKSILLQERKSIRRLVFPCLPRGFCAVLVANHAVGRCLSRIVGRMSNMRASNAGGLTRWEKGSALRMEQIERCSIAAASHSMRQRIVILRRRIGVLDHFQYIAYLSHSIYFLSIINNIF